MLSNLTLEDIEAHVLTSLMFGDQKYIEILEETYFSKITYKKIFVAIKALFKEGLEIDLLLVRHKLGEIYGEKEATELILDATNAEDKCASFSDIENYIKILVHTKQLSDISRLGKSLDSEANKVTAEAEKIVRQAEEKLKQIEGLKFAKYDPSLGGIATELLEELAEKNNQTKPSKELIKTPFSILNKYIPQFQEGELIIIAARPSIGKSSLAHQLAEFNSFRNIPVAILTTEMDKKSVFLRIACKRALVDYTVVRDRTKNLSPEKAKRFKEEIYNIPNYPLYIEDRISYLQDIKNSARELVEQNGCKAIFIDHLSEIIQDDKDRSENTNVFVSKVCKHIKSLAKELRIPVFLLCQLNRGIEHRSETRPTLSDLRDSGTIEQTADIVMFIHQPEKTGAKKNTEEKKEVNEDTQILTEIIIAKNRNGRTGIMSFWFQPVFTTFFEMETRYDF